MLRSVGSSSSCIAPRFHYASDNVEHILKFTQACARFGREREREREKENCWHNRMTTVPHRSVTIPNRCRMPKSPMKISTQMAQNRETLPSEHASRMQSSEASVTAIWCVALLAGKQAGRQAGRQRTS
ncbi:hypothetical protein Mp_3g06010 [Marchantia polymorpha subsp. ruderalis]|uniref:Uncharacterized protein n=2 Tax=Marchantia polymorpha TaxID=3197 RepID=A0AAF6AXW2_MARPO|nr:hypothetical protein MARPO_0006s0071 [Marchantia polymorpha]BBN04596.1 hypothetical protein Mp_3g06010 [Marchantia polymorpha subsp. ruderalis]|eukprot:PTQ48032.1 hypothetical protein MARPO_0006s0071 [Marchantia polymorpha]